MARERPRSTSPHSSVAMQPAEAPRARHALGGGAARWFARAREDSEYEWKGVNSPVITPPEYSHGTASGLGRLCCASVPGVWRGSRARALSAPRPWSGRGRTPSRGEGRLPWAGSESNNYASREPKTVSVRFFRYTKLVSFTELRIARRDHVLPDRSMLIAKSCSTPR